MNTPKISVIMSVYNGERYLREAIESILNQTFADFEFIMVNDGSSDSSMEIIQSYNDERIKVIVNKENIGLTKSLNKALKQAKGEYVARQDADDTSLPNRFEEQIKYLELHPETALLGTSYYLINGAGRIIGRKIALSNPGQNLNRGNKFVHGSVMFKKEVIDRLGPYNELLRYSQDYELWIRIARHYRVANLAQPLYKLRMHPGAIWYTKTKERFLYTILAHRMAEDRMSEEAVGAIETKGIIGLCPYLTLRERLTLVAKRLLIVRQKHISRHR